MLRMIAILKRKPGLTVEEFRWYYENTHAPLIRSFEGSFLHKYTRKYLVEGGTIAGDPNLDFDVITECVYQDRKAFDNAMALLMEPENNRLREIDELAFLDINGTRVFLVEEFGD